MNYKISSSISLNSPQFYGLIILRVLIGWHILYEGVSKLINPYWSSAAYLLDSKWIFSGIAQMIVSNPTLLTISDLINVWGADHHGYIKRIEASIDAIGSKKEKLIVKLVQFANLFKNGKSVKMSTRSGEFFTLRELLEDIGSDAARFYYLSKQADQHLDFDLDLAKSDSKENIFYYIQYAHARIFSLEQKYKEMYPKLDTNIEAIEKDLYKKCDSLIHEISKYPHIINKSARTLQPHIIIFYLRDLSQLFHSYYNDNHVLSESKENMQSIILCLSALRQVISNGLGILGISPMQKM